MGGRRQWQPRPLLLNWSAVAQRDSARSLVWKQGYVRRSFLACRETESSPVGQTSVGSARSERCARHGGAKNPLVPIDNPQPKNCAARSYRLDAQTHSLGPSSPRLENPDRQPTQQHQQQWRSRRARNRRQHEKESVKSSNRVGPPSCCTSDNHSRCRSSGGSLEVLVGSP